MLYEYYELGTVSEPGKTHCCLSFVFLDPGVKLKYYVYVNQTYLFYSKELCFDK